MRNLAILLLGSILLPAYLGAGEEPDSYATEIATWREERLARLKAEGGFLTLAGLYWLEEGDNHFGSAEDNDLIFPETTPAHIGTFTLKAGAVSLTVLPGIDLLRDHPEAGQIPVSSLQFPNLSSADPEPLALGTFRFYPIERSGRFGVRLKDLDSEVLRDFRGIDHFPINEKWRVEGRFVPFAEPKTLQVPTIIGTTTEISWPGMVHFEIDGEEHDLVVFGEVEDSSWFTIFADRTRGVETYGGGRFLGIENAGEGGAVIDFNKAYNPPCAFTPFATCPLPPQQNILTIRVEAGEKNYGHH